MSGFGAMAVLAAVYTFERAWLISGGLVVLLGFSGLGVVVLCSSVVETFLSLRLWCTHAVKSYSATGQTFQ